MGRSPSSAREEERRKVLEIEEERLRREREIQLRRGASNAGQVNRSASRASRVGGGQVLGPRSKSKTMVAVDDHDSQYSGHSSSTSVMRKEPVGGAPIKVNRFDQNRIGGRVKRSTSNATNTTVASSGARREIINRKKMPGSVTSSLNSSESEQGGNNTPVGNGGQRSVFLHAACVADIPPNSEKRIPPRALSAESRSNLANAGVGPAGAGGQRDGSSTPAPPPPPSAQASNLQKSKKISRSISLLAPWKPKQVARQFEIHYDNSAIYSGNGGGAGKPPRPPPTAAGRRAATMQRDKRSASSSDLLRGGETESSEGAISPTSRPGSKEGNGIGIIGEQRSPSRNAGVSKKQPQQQSSSSTKVSRSVSMPKDTRLAGWFKKRKRVA